MKRVVLVALGALLVAVLSPSAHAGLVKNGGFETGNLTDWTLSGSDANFAATGFVHAGRFAFFMGQVGSLGSLSQTLDTTADAHYSLTFWFAADGNPGEFQALIGSTKVLDLPDAPFDIDYRPYTFDFIATGASTLLTFRFRDNIDFLALDDVDVVRIASVPEPETLALLLAGVIGLAATRASRRKARKPA